MKSILNIFLMIAPALIIGCLPDGEGDAGDISGDTTAINEYEVIPDSLAEEGYSVFKVVPKKSVLQWRGERITGEGHQGTVDISQGNIRVRDERMEGGQIRLDMTSMKETGEEREEETSSVVMGYLHSQRFFDTEKYPEAVLTIKGENQGMLIADLKIRDVTRAVMIPIKKRMSGDTLMANGNFAIDRTQWGINFRSAGKNKDLGSLVIKDSIYFKTRVLAIKER